MTSPGYQEGHDRVLWWRAAMHLDEARLAVGNAMAHGLDDPTMGLALQDKLRDAQVILLEIFRARGLLPRGTNGKIEVPLPLAVAVVSTPEPSTAVVSAEPEEAPDHVAVSAAEEAAAYEEAVEAQVPVAAVVAVSAPVAEASSEVET